MYTHIFLLTFLPLVGYSGVFLCAVCLFESHLFNSRSNFILTVGLIFLRYVVSKSS